FPPGAAGALSAAPAARAAAALLDASDVRRFASRPDLEPPIVSVLQRKRGAAPGLVFMAPSSGPGQRGALIFDDAGEPVWFRPVVGKSVTDTKVQQLHGRPVLTWWEGLSVRGLGDGEWVVVDPSYRELARFSAAQGLPGDLHEFTISPWNTALVTSNEVKTWDLSGVGGSTHGHVVGGVVQELELP